MLLKSGVFSSREILLETNDTALLDLSECGGTNLHLLNGLFYSAPKKTLL
jgi:hypothetical protein